MELFLAVEPLIGSQIKHQTLIGLSGGEVRDKGNHQIDGNDEKNHAEEEIEQVVFENIFYAKRFFKGSTFLFLFLFYHCIYCYLSAKVIVFY